jgi:SAM-dependent methyltransferase
VIPDRDRWSHDIQYHPVVLEAVPERARVLDVGCGEGMLARRLRARGAEVVALDRDGGILRLARGHPDGAGIRYVRGDILDDPFAEASFDAVVAVASLHHLGTRSGLRVMRRLVRPGGTLGIVGLGRPAGVLDVLADAAAVFATRVVRVRRGLWSQLARTRPPLDTYAEIRRVVAAVLPGARFRRRLFWRYTVTWRKPET